VNLKKKKYKLNHQKKLPVGTKEGRARRPSTSSGSIVSAPNRRLSAIAGKEE